MAYEAFYWSYLGDKYRFETLEELVQHHWAKFLNGVGDNFRVIDTYDRQRVDIEIVKRVFNRLYNAYMGRWYIRRAGNYKFRDGPVPGIRCRRGGRRGSYYRQIRTHQERRENSWIEHDEDIENIRFKARVARTKLPSNWDDIGRYDQRNKSWKRYRVNQWKE
jgi:hypothetical protein